MAGTGLTPHVLAVFPYYLAPDAPNTAGVKTSLLNLLRGLTAEGVDSTVLVPAANPSYDRDFTEAGAREVIELGLPRHLVFERHRAGPAYLARYPAQLRAETRMLEELLPGLGVDIVHSHGSAFLGACRAARSAGLPSVLHVHEDIVRLPGWAQPAYLARVPRMADRLICCADFLRDRFIGAGASPERCVAIPNSVDLARFTADGPRPLRDELGVAGGEVLVGFAGRLVQVKDPLRFLGAARIAAARRPSAKFVVIGGGGDPADDRYVRRLHEEAATPGLAGRVSFAGPRSDMPDVLRSLDIFVMCSHNEAMPNTVLEAMATGTAVVDQSGGGSPEALGYGAAGRIVGGKDPEDLAVAISELAADGHLRRALSSVARRRAEEIYSIEAAARAVAGVYRDLLGGAPDGQNTPEGGG